MDLKRYFIKINGSKVFVTEWGKIGNPVIICLHGLGSSSLSFIEIGEELKNHFHIISVDAPGHGKTPAFQTESNYEMANMVSWLTSILNTLKIDRFYFLSHSWGSFIALHFLVYYPERVIKTILIDGGYQTKREQGITLDEEMDYYEKDFEEYVFESWDDYLAVEQKNYLRWSLLLEIAVRDLMVEDNNRIRWHASGQIARSIIRAMHKNETKEIYNLLPSSIKLLRATLPKSLEESRARAAEIFQELASGIVKPIQGTTHMLHWDKPEAVIEEILLDWR